MKWEVNDAVLNYLNVGGLGGPPDVPTWIEQYELTKHIEAQP